MSDFSKNGLALQLGDISKYLDRLKQQKETLESERKDWEREKAEIESELRGLQQKKAEVESGIRSKNDALKRLDRTISEAENTYMKLLESSQTLAALVKKEWSEIDTSLNTSP